MISAPRNFARRLKPLIPSFVWRLARRTLVERRLPPVVRAVRQENLSYLGEQGLSELHEAVTTVEAAGVEGVFLEAGCAFGGSALVIASAKARGRPLRLYDVFGMPPAPSAGDGPDVAERWAEIAGGRSPGIADGPYYGYSRDLLATVRKTFDRFGLHPDANRIAFVPGLVGDTLELNEPVALAHLDCDRYASVKVCLERIAPWLAVGGKILIDDYDAKSGCRRAVDEFMAERGASFDMRRRTHVVIERKTAQN